MSQAQLLTPSTVSLPPVTYKGQPVVTTEMLAKAYGCSAENIRKNFSNNRERFVEGKHFFNLADGELKSFRDCVKNIPTVGDCTETFGAVVPARTRNLTLWLERGAARHAKMLNTDQAWDVFEMLEETFFRAVKAGPAHQPPLLDDHTRLSRRTDPERKQLTAIINTWVASAPVHYASARSQVNAHFGVVSVDGLTVAQVREAITWVQGKIDEAPKALPASQPDKPSGLQAALEIPESARLNEVYFDIKRHARGLEDGFREIHRIVGNAMPPVGRQNAFTLALVGNNAQSVQNTVTAMNYMLDGVYANVRATMIACGM